MSRLKHSEFYFPDPERTLDDGLLCIGGNLEVETLCEAYSKGIFPWPQEGYPLLWFSPPERGVLDFEDLHISRSLKKMMGRVDWTLSFNQCFESVIQACAAQERPGQDGTWILSPMVEAYINLHRAGYAHSIEVWQGSDLIGGLYGVYIGGVFSGESMFYKQPNASKFAFISFVDFLKSKGLTWLDMQMVTPSLKAFGGKYISREEFLRRLEEAHRHSPETLF